MKERKKERKWQSQIIHMGYKFYDACTAAYTLVPMCKRSKPQTIVRTGALAPQLIAKQLIKGRRQVHFTAKIT
jgi:hypothetical protein